MAAVFMVWSNLPAFQECWQMEYLTISISGHIEYQGSSVQKVLYLLRTRLPLLLGFLVHDFVEIQQVAHYWPTGSL